MTAGRRSLTPPDSFEAAFDDLLHGAYKIAYRILGSVTEAEDAAAESLARALLRWPEIADKDYRDAWVMRVAANVAIDAARRRRVDPHTAGAVSDQSDETALRVTMVAALAKLPRRQREVIALRHLGGFSQDDIAHVLRISPNSVKTHGDRGLRALRDRFGPNLEADLA